MVRMGPRMTPTMGPIVGPNPAIGGGTDPLDGFTEAFLVSDADDWIVLSGATVLATGDGPFRLTTTGTLPGGSASATDYWLTILSVGDPDSYRLATSLADALADIYVDILDAGTGTHTITYVG